MRVDLGIVDVRRENAFAQITSTTTRVTPPSRRNAVSCSSAQICVLERNADDRTAFLLCPSVITNSRVRRYLPVAGSRTMGPVP